MKSRKSEFDGYLDDDEMLNSESVEDSSPYHSNNAELFDTNVSYIACICQLPNWDVLAISFKSSSQPYLFFLTASQPYHISQLRYKFMAFLQFIDA